MNMVPLEQLSFESFAGLVKTGFREFQKSSYRAHVWSAVALRRFSHRHVKLC
jgi:hypothetical protein